MKWGLFSLLVSYCSRRGLLQLGLAADAAVGGLVKRAEVLVKKFVVCRDGNHGGVVGSVGEFGYVNIPTTLVGPLLKGFAKGCIGRHPSREGHVVYARLLDGQVEFLHENVYDCGFERGCEVFKVVGYEIRVSGELVA